ncbi:polysaccharide biosynthesis/export family protein [Sphingomonas sp.]|jgi:polysaccharide export outer membrane protein|uniref:polysaccharide biosynthesis/export family protein n=1 Tax=Sphingomonas sp. TaxID=28214 RepID=UPI002DE32EF8|nr:polysaccharide biosynthesis/export family protein [Sphingomonas sp.]
MFVRSAALAVMLGSLLTACAGSGRLQSSQAVRVVPSAELPPPARVDLFSQERPYLVGPFDKLKIDVFGIKELSEREIQVDASGRASFPLVGSFQAAGRTPNEIAQELESKLAGNYIRNPQVTVNLEETVSQVVTVDGQVIKPGLYPVIGRMTLMRAVATAGGTAEFAKLDDVVVFRTVSGAQYAALYNLRAIRRGAYADPEIFANDIVVVGDSQARRIFKDVLQAAPLLTAPIVVALQNN